MKIRLLSLLGVPETLPTTGIYRIICNLIGREDGNSHGIIGFVYIESKNVVEFQPTHSPWYKLRFQEISFAEIILQSVTTDENINFEELAFQFEVSEIYGGV